MPVSPSPELDPALLHALQLALRGSSYEQPLDIARLLAAVDARERVLLACDEFNAGLAILVGAGRAREIRPGWYCVGDGRAAASPHFSPVHEQAFAAACDAYRRRAYAAFSNDEADETEGFVRHLFSVHLPGGGEDLAEEIAGTLDALLSASQQAEINGLASSNEATDILIYACADPSHDDALQAAVLAALRAQPSLPAGSLLVRITPTGGQVLPVL